MNSLQGKPFYTHHRIVSADGDPIAKENTTIAGMITDLKLRGPSGNEMLRGVAHAAGWRKIDGRVFLTGGTTPTVTLQAYELIRYKEDFGEGNVVDELVIFGSTIGPLSHGDKFPALVENFGASLFFAIDAVTGVPTKVEVMLAGGDRDLEALRVG
jgi:hypothetical protein